MQFYILAPFLVLLFNRSRRAGLCLWAVCLLASIIVPFTIAYQNSLSLNFSLKGEDSGPVASLLDKPYSRSSPYLLGLACAYLMCSMRWDKPTAHVSFRRRIHLLGWSCSAVFMFLCVYGLSGSSGRVLPGGGRLGNAMWLACARLLWGLALFWVTLCCATRQVSCAVATHTCVHIACQVLLVLHCYMYCLFSFAEYFVIAKNTREEVHTDPLRQAGPINSFLSAPVWLPASRLTYCAYLVGPTPPTSKFFPLVDFRVVFRHSSAFTVSGTE